MTRHIHSLYRYNPETGMYHCLCGVQFKNSAAMHRINQLLLKNREVTAP